MKSSEVDIVVVSYNERERLLACCRSAIANPMPVRLIVVDNASTDGSVETVRKSYPAAEVIPMPSNLGFAAAVNRGVEAGQAPLVLLLNNDARLKPEALDALMEAVKNDRVGAAGPRLVGPAGQVELSVGRTMGPLNEVAFRVLDALYRDGRGPLVAAVERYYGRPRWTRSLSGACILLRREALEGVGGFDERFFLYAEDVDLCRRLRRQGWRLRYIAGAVVEHDRGASRTHNPTEATLAYRRSQLAFYRKHHGALAANALRFYLTLRFAVSSVVTRGERRELATTMLRWALRQAGQGR